MRQQDKTHAQAFVAQTLQRAPWARAVGVVRRRHPGHTPQSSWNLAHTTPTWDIRPFANVEQAQDWYGAIADAPGSIRYAAYFDRDDPAWPGPVNEMDGQVTSGDVVGRRFGGGGFGGGRLGRRGGGWGHHHHHRFPPQQPPFNPAAFGGYDSQSPPPVEEEYEESQEIFVPGRGTATPLQPMVKGQAWSGRAAGHHGHHGNELLALLPSLAAGITGLTFNLDLGSDLQLHTKVCVNGTCYESTTDMTSVLASILSDVSGRHQALHEQGADPLPPEESPTAAAEVQQKTDEAVQAAGMMTVGALYDQHLRSGCGAVTTGGLWDKFQKLARKLSVSHQLASIPAIADTLQKFKPMITNAAMTVASAYAGPAGGAMAKAFAPIIVDDLSKNKNNPNPGATQLLADAHEAAKSDPEVARALDSAHQAVVDTVSTYHLSDTANKAADGDPHAARKIAELDHEAGGGNAAAAQAMQIVAQVLQAAASKPAASVGAEHARGKVHQEMLALRREGSLVAQALRAERGTRSIGYAKLSGGDEHPGEHGTAVQLTDSTILLPFDVMEEAAAWLQTVDQYGDGLRYAAIYDADGLLWPGPVNEVFGQRSGVAASWQADVTTAGDFRVDPLERYRKVARHVLNDRIVSAETPFRLWFLPNVNSRPSVYEFTTPYEAEVWMSAVPFRQYTYAALFVPGSPPAAMWERLGGQAQVTTGGLGILPWIAMAAAGGAGWYGQKWWQGRHKAAAKTQAPPVADAQSAATASQPM